MAIEFLRDAQNWTTKYLSDDKKQSYYDAIKKRLNRVAHRGEKKGNISPEYAERARTFARLYDACPLVV